MSAWRFELLGYPAGFAQPLFLLLCLAAVALGAFGLVQAARRRARVHALLAERFADRLTPGVSVARPLLKNGAAAAGLFLFALALGQPQCGSATELTKKRGIDVVVALDTSKSMLARDVAPDRLERAKLELMTLLDSLKGDRVGIVVFAGDAFIQSPLTSDYAAAKLFLRAVDPEQMQQGGTNIGAALMLSKQVLDGADRGAADRVIVLLSDGEDLGGEIEEAVAALEDANIRVLAVGVGSESGEPIPVLDKRGEVVGYKKDERGDTVVSRLDRAGLAAIARATDGELFFQPRGVAMAQVVERIDRMQKSELESRLTVRYDERYQFFALPGFLLLALSMLLRPSRRVGAKQKPPLPPAAKSALSVLLAVALVLPSTPAFSLGPLQRNHPKVEEGAQAYREGRHADALKAFDEAKGQLPPSLALELNRGAALYKLGRLEEAKAAFQRAAEAESPELRQRALYDLGNVEAALGREKEAIRAYRRSLLLNPHDADARHNLELLLRKPPPPPPLDGGTDGGGDGGTDAGTDGGADGGQPDGGQGDGGTGDAGTGQGGGDAGTTDGGMQADGGAQTGDEGEPRDGGGAAQEEPPTSDGGTSEPQDEGDGGIAPEELLDAGTLDPSRLSKEEAQKLLDSMKQNEKNLQLWRFQQRKKKRPADAKDW